MDEKTEQLSREILSKLKVEDFLRKTIRGYQKLLLQDAKQLLQIEKWLRSRETMRMMPFEWKVGIVLLGREIQKAVQDIVTSIHDFRYRYRFYECC